MITLSTSLRSFTCLTALLLAGLLLGCDNSEKVCRPCGDEKIVGQIVGVDGPFADCSVEAFLADPAPGSSLGAETRTDADGRYELTVPPGKYLLYAEPYGWHTVYYNSPNATYRRSIADTIVVAGGDAATADITLGAFEILLHLPPGVDLSTVDCLLYDDFGSSSVRQEEISDGTSPAVGAFSALPPGVYRIRIELRSYAGETPWYSYMWLAHYLTRQQSDFFVVEPLEMTSWEGTLPVPGYVRGTTQGCWEAAEYHPYVRLYASDGNAINYGSALTEEGTFQLPVFAPGDVRVRVDTYPFTRWVGGTSLSSASRFHIGSGLTVDVDPLSFSCIRCNLSTLEEWQPFRGRYRVFDESGEPIADRSLSRESPTWIIGLRPGTYSLEVRPDDGEGWRVQWYDRSASQDGATPIVIASDQDQQEIDIVLEEGGRIRGRVLDEAGEGADNLRLQVSGLTVAWYSYYGWRTDSEGSFVVEGLPDGDFRIGARYYIDDEDAISYYPGVSDPDSAEVITIIDAGEVTGIEWQIQP